MKILTVITILLLVFSAIVVSANVKDYSNNVRNLPFEKGEDEIYYSYDELTELLVQLQEEYSDILNYSSLGKTHEGRDIWLVKISDNVTIDEDEPEVLISGGVHGDEKQTYMVAIYSIKAIVENYTSANVNLSFTMRIRNVVNNSKMYFMPMVNPDGCEAGVRKNGRLNKCPLGKTIFRGVDVNRNFDFKWEEFDKHPFRYRRSGMYSSSGMPRFFEKTHVKYPFFDWRSVIGEGCYRGPYPFSEPESRAMKQFIENHSVIIYMDYHSYFESIQYPWGWTGDPTPDENIFVSIAENISNINGYKINQYGKNYPILGLSKDWMYDKYGIFAMGIELSPTNADGYSSPGMNKPLLPICKTHVLVNLYLAERAMMLAS